MGGDFSAKVFEKLPPKSKLIVVGNLTSQPLGGFNSGDFIFNGKSVRAFFLWAYLAEEITPQEAAEWFKKVSDDLRDGGKIFGT